MRAACLLALLAAIPLLNRAYEAWERSLYLNVGMPIAPVFQYDYPDAVCRIAGEDKSVATSGCGAACMSMVVQYLTGNESQTPQTLFERAYESGDYIGKGLSHAAMKRLGQAYGVEGVWIGRNENRVRKALETGFPVIAHMGPGTFTKEGHYILLRGITDDDRVLVNDPNSERRTGKPYDLDMILREAKGEEPFMICQRDF